MRIRKIEHVSFSRGIPVNESEQPRGSRLEQAVADQYRKEGYEVIVEPDPSLIPFDLGRYRPDLIARRGDVSLIIEVKGNTDRMSFDQLREIANEVRQHQGWRLVLVTADDVLNHLTAMGSDPRTSPEELSKSIERAKRLKELGDTEAAFFALWVVFERMMRAQVVRIGLPIERLAPSILIRQLYSQGELSIPSFDLAMNLMQVRNRVAHGLEVLDIENDYLNLKALIEGLLSEWFTETDQPG